MTKNTQTPTKKPAAKKSTASTTGSTPQKTDAIAPTKKATKKNSGRNLSLGSIIVIVIVVAGAYVGNQLGLIDGATFEEILADVLDEGGTGPADFDLPGEADVVFATATPFLGGSGPDEWYRIVFTQPQYPDEPDTRINEIEQALIEVINGAHNTLDIAIFELDLDSVGNAILAARERGTKVRIVTDSTSLEESDTLIRLEKEGVRIVGDNRDPLMHNKFVVVDGRAVWTGSWNFTTNGTFRNNNYGIYIQSSQLAENYHAEFEEMFTEQAFGPTSPINTPNPRIIIGDTLLETCFAPEDKCAAQLVSLIRQAQHSIRFMAFSFTNDDIGKIVRDRGRDGILIQGIFEERGSDTEFSEYGKMRRQKLDVLRDGNPYILHHKIFIIDERTVVLGSYNFSDSADSSNDENMLIIHDAEVTEHFMAEFERMYDLALNPL